MRLKSHLPLYLLTPHCYIIKMSKWRFRVPNFYLFPLKLKCLSKSFWTFIIISRYLAVTSSYHSLFHNIFFAAVYGENVVRNSTVELKLNMSRDEIVKKINLMIRISSLEKYVFKMREMLYFLFL